MRFEHSTIIKKRNDCTQAKEAQHLSCHGVGSIPGEVSSSQDGGWTLILAPSDRYKDHYLTRLTPPSDLPLSLSAVQCQFGPCGSFSDPLIETLCPDLAPVATVFHMIRRLCLLAFSHYAYDISHLVSTSESSQYCQVHHEHSLSKAIYTQICLAVLSMQRLKHPIHRSNRPTNVLAVEQIFTKSGAK